MSFLGFFSQETLRSAPAWDSICRRYGDLGDQRAGILETLPGVAPKAHESDRPSADGLETTIHVAGSLLVYYEGEDEHRDIETCEPFNKFIHQGADCLKELLDKPRVYPKTRRK
jgi:hypothetical protein